MTEKRQLLPEQHQIQNLKFTDSETRAAADVVFTREHEAIRQWAEVRQAQPATGEATRSGPATVHVNDGGAGIRFNFPGAGSFRPISWDEWFANFDRHECAFVFEADAAQPPLSNRYRIVKADEWKELLR